MLIIIMAFSLEANINVLWQNLIALNASLIRENEEQRVELLQAKEQLQKELENSKILQEKNATQLQKITRLSSKMVAVRQIVSFEPVDDDDVDTITANATNLPIIVKVESVESEPIATDYDNTNLVPRPVNVCHVCDKKFCSSSSLKRHNMTYHLTPSYPCPKCPQKFARKDYAQRHYKQTHRNDEENVSARSNSSKQIARITRANAAL